MEKKSIELNDYHDLVDDVKDSVRKADFLAHDLDNFFSRYKQEMHEGLLIHDYNRLGTEMEMLTDYLMKIRMAVNDLREVTGVTQCEEELS